MANEIVFYGGLTVITIVIFSVVTFEKALKEINPLTYKINNIPELELLGEYTRIIGRLQKKQWEIISGKEKSYDKKSYKLCKNSSVDLYLFYVL